ncbi:hypothetical protein Fot_11108 [Forsythia ovata]|uniref:Uncharacterized protein n=1 Tax=Forsythia ovata TaxID=205694 RepID=A0ABD1WLH7_9LAMI
MLASKPVDIKLKTISERRRCRAPRKPRVATPPQEEEAPSSEFVTRQQFVVLQEQITTIMAMLQRTTAHLPPIVETPPNESMPTHASAPYVTAILSNFKRLLNQMIEEAIARRKNKGCLISIKEKLFTEEVMVVPLPLKFKELTDGFDGTTDLNDHIRTSKIMSNCTR